MAENNELAPIDDAVEVLDKIDDDAIIDIMTGQAIQDYVYSFKQGGKTVEGLTLAGVNEAANRHGGMCVEDVTYEEKDNSWIVVAKACDTISGNSRYGAYEQAKRMGNREDPHAFTKAIHKAQRNAIKQLLPVAVIKNVLNFYLRKDSGTDQKQLPKDTAPSAQKTVMSCAGALEKKLEPQGLVKDDLWNYVKRRYSVNSGSELTNMQWSQLSAEFQAANNADNLFNELVKRVTQMKAAVAESEVTEETNDDTTTEGE